MMTAVEAFVERLQAIAKEEAEDQEKIRFDREAALAVADELTALQAIYGDDRVALLATRRSANGAVVSSVIEQDASSDKVDALIKLWSPFDPIRLAISIDTQLSEEQVGAEPVRLSAVLPPSYPYGTSAPQLQILSRYVGPYGVDHALFGQIVRIFMSGNTSKAHLHTAFVTGQVALFDGVEKARDIINAWLQEHRSSTTIYKSNQHTIPEDKGMEEHNESDIDLTRLAITDPSAKSQVKLFTAESITERKSVFMGHAAVLHDPAEVEKIIDQLLQDRRIARATHPAIFAWCVRTSDGVLHRDCDDDGETAAGGRLAHLLDLLRIENVIVIVTRWYGGVLLGPDRFKYINRAARDALELANLIDKSGPAVDPNSKQPANGKTRRAA
jgi:hypothetical protein